MDYTSEYIRSFHITDNDLVLYWKGINMTDLSKQLPDVSVKEYYQFEKPLFLNSDFSIEQLIQYNKFFFNKIGLAENADMSLLIDNPYFVLATISKKAISSSDERFCYTVRLNNGYSNKEIEIIKKFFIQKLRVNSLLTLNIFNCVNAMYQAGYYKTYPLCSFSLSKHPKSGGFYGQVLITNNYDTSQGSIHPIPLSIAKQNTFIIFKQLGIEFEPYFWDNLIRLAYEEEMMLFFYGFDISQDKVEKFKIYFRLKDEKTFLNFSLSLEKYFELFGLKRTWKFEDVSAVPNNESTVNIFALSFKIGDMKQLELKGIQFYLVP